MAPSLNGRTFVGVRNSASGEVSGATVFRYREHDGRIWAEYGGGAVERGYLVGTRTGDALDFRYVHLSVDGATATGHCTARLEVLADGRIRSHETWEWESREGAGSSVVEERQDRPVAGFWICATCAVEHAERVEVCAICADERQWVPADGQRWTTLEELAADGRRVQVTELEPDLFGITTTEKTGIGQTAKLVRTPSGNLLWDPIGYLDADGVAQVRELGEVAAIVASHPHMYGVQVEWSRRLGGVPVLVAEADRKWVARPDPLIRTWSGRLDILPGITLTQPGGHFPGSAVAYWAGADGRGVLLSGDTVFANPDRRSVAFMRSYPNHLPLSAAVTRRVARALEEFDFDRLYGNFDIRVDTDAKAVVRRSADRHVGWVRGDFDHLT